MRKVGNKVLHHEKCVNYGDDDKAGLVSELILHGTVMLTCTVPVPVSVSNFNSNHKSIRLTKRE